MKNAPHQNVVNINKHDKPRAVSNSSMTQLLNLSRDTAATRLSIAAIDMLRQASDELFELSEKSTNNELRNLYRDAMSLTRDKCDVIGADFKVKFTQGFSKEAYKDKSGSLASSNPLTVSEFSLVDLDDLEQSLASINIANILYGKCAEALFGIEKRVGALLHDPELAEHANPLGPEVIGIAFMDALKLQNTSVKIMLLMVKLFNKYMPEPTKNMYQEINQLLVEKGVLPKIRIGMRIRTASDAAPSSSPQMGSATHSAPQHSAPQMNSGEMNLFATLQQLMSFNVGGAGSNNGQPGNAPIQQGGYSGAGSSAQDGAFPINNKVMDALNKLQHGQFDGYTLDNGSLNATTVANGRTNVLRDIKASTVASALGHVDAMTLDIVAMLFDYILDDRNIPDAMKALIGRLQIPVLKVAMLDKTFFSHKAHPARKFLDTLASAAIGWNEEEGHQSGLYKNIDTQIQKILNEFEDKVGIFTEVYENLSQFLAIEKQHADEMTGRSAKIVHLKEQGEIAKIMAHDEIRQRLQTQHLPDVIRVFLTNQWKQVLAQTFILTGEESVAWNTALGTMDDLIWSATRIAAPEDRKKLVSLLPSLLKRLQDGMDIANTPEDERNQFFTKLVKCHADAVKSCLQAEPTENIDALNDFDLAHNNAALSPSEFEEVSLTDHSFESGEYVIPAIDINIEQPTALSLTNDTDNEAQRQGQQPIAGDDYDAMVTHLKRGTWIDFTHSDETHTRVKLAWVSPMKGLYLFTNRLGERAMSITPTGLASKFRDGRAEIVNDEALVDRAVSDLLEKLKQPNALSE